jgi:KaiC/GvpD/RAD55 family RecA-like ATPase
MEKDWNCVSSSAITELPRFLGIVKGVDEIRGGALLQGHDTLVECVPPFEERVQKKKLIFARDFLGPLTNEGVPEGSNICLIGPPGVGKTIFCQNLADYFLREHGNCLYVTLDKAPNEVRNDFLELRTVFSEKDHNKRLVFVDGFSWLIGKSQEDYSIENLANLTELSIRIASASCDLAGPILLVFDSVSPLPVYNPENAVVKFLQLLLARMKDWRGIGVYVVQEGVHTSEFCNTLGYLVDGVFDMKLKEAERKIRRYFRIRSLKFTSHDTRWIPFTIQANRGFKLSIGEGETR